MFHGNVYHYHINNKKAEKNNRDRLVPENQLNGLSAR